MKKINTKKVAAGTGFVALAATALIGGTLAQFTDRDTTDTQTLQAGTVDVTLTEGANWDTSALLLGVDDTVDRTVTVTNDGNLAIKSIDLSSTVTDTPGEFGGNLSEAVLVTVLQDGVELAAPVLLSNLDDYTLTLPAEGLLPAETTDLEFVYQVVGTEDATTPGTYTEGDYVTGARNDVATNPDNAFQGSALDVAYTVDAVQRDGVAQ